MTQTIIVADDHPLFRAALKQAVNQAVPDAETVEVEELELEKKQGLMTLTVRTLTLNIERGISTRTA